MIYLRALPSLPIGGVLHPEITVSAWQVVGSLTAAVVASRAKLRLGSFYAIVDPDRPHQPTGRVLRIVAVQLRDYATRLTGEADRLERVADETEKD